MRLFRKLMFKRSKRPKKEQLRQSLVSAACRKKPFAEISMVAGSNAAQRDRGCTTGSQLVLQLCKAWRTGTKPAQSNDGNRSQIGSIYDDALYGQLRRVMPEMKW